MRILFIVPYIPNLIRVRPFNLIRALEERGHQVTVLTLTTGLGDERDASALEEHCYQVFHHPISRWRSIWNCVASLPSGEPLQSVYSWQPAAAHGLQDLISAPNGRQPFDLIHVEHLRGVRYGLRAKELLHHAGKPIPVVWDSVDCISLLFRQAAGQSKNSFGRWMTRFELGRTERYESWLVGQFDQVMVTSETDKRALENLTRSGAIDKLGKSRSQRGGLAVNVIEC